MAQNVFFFPIVVSLACLALLKGINTLSQCPNWKFVQTSVCSPIGWVPKSNWMRSASYLKILAYFECLQSIHKFETHPCNTCCEFTNFNGCGLPQSCNKLQTFLAPFGFLLSAKSGAHLKCACGVSLDFQWNGRVTAALEMRTLKDAHPKLGHSRSFHSDWFPEEFFLKPATGRRDSGQPAPNSNIYNNNMFCLNAPWASARCIHL